jgi:hypothetical protein
MISQPRQGLNYFVWGLVLITMKSISLNYVQPLSQGLLLTCAALPWAVLRQAQQSPTVIEIQLLRSKRLMPKLRAMHRNPSYY